MCKVEFLRTLIIFLVWTSLWESKPYSSLAHWWWWWWWWWWNLTMQYMCCNVLYCTCAVMWIIYIENGWFRQIIQIQINIMSFLSDALSSTYAVMCNVMKLWSPVEPIMYSKCAVNAQLLCDSLCSKYAVMCNVMNYGSHQLVILSWTYLKMMMMIIESNYKAHVL